MFPSGYVVHSNLFTDLRSGQLNFDHLITALEARDVLAQEERAAIAALPHTIRHFARGETVVAEGSRPTESCLLIAGMAARTVHTPDGKRQITAVHIPGDFVDLHGMLLRIMDHNVVALSAVTAAFVPHGAVAQIAAKYPHVGRLFWMLTVIDAAIHRAWLTCIGRKSPQRHIGHLFCELFLRLERVGLAKQNRFEFPATQGELADMLGLSLVHVNKSLSQLRKSGLFRWSGSVVEIADFERLADYADFDPTYLSFHREPR